MKKIRIVSILLGSILLFKSYLSGQSFSTHSTKKEIISLSPENVSDSIIKFLNGNKVVLSSEEDSESSEFEPIYKNRKMIINDTWVINVDSLCKLKSKSFNPSFNFYSLSLVLIKKSKKMTRFSVFLGQVGCSGDFCRDLIALDVSIQNGTIAVDLFDL